LNKAQLRGSTGEALQQAAGSSNISSKVQRAVAPINKSMKKILVTGAKGFIGRNLCLALRRSGQAAVMEIGSDHSELDLVQAAAAADVVVHLAGVNRPDNEEDFVTGNVSFIRTLTDLLKKTGRIIPVMCSSSTQAERENAYGESKLCGEKILQEYSEQTGAGVYIFRLPNVFGKWSRPEYNTVVATFCHNISRGLPVTINNPAAMITFAYVDDVVSQFVALALNPEGDEGVLQFAPAYDISLGALHDKIVSFKDSRTNLKLANFGDPLTKYLYSTYLSFLERDDFSYPADVKTDDRGWLFELIKSETAGQMFVSSTKPGITRGNHYHDTKVEKFCVVKGQGVIHFRHVLEETRFEYAVSDQAIQIVDIPPGYTHSIENTGTDEMVTLFWANEIFEPERMDTYFETV